MIFGSVKVYAARRRRAIPEERKRMRGWISSILLLLAVSWTLQSARAEAAELTRSAMEAALASRRTAAGYLRTENADLALIEIERLIGQLKGSDHEVTALAAARAAEARDLDAAGREIAALGQRLAEERRRAGYRLLADCIGEASAAYSRLDRHRLAPPDLSDAAIVAAIAAAAADTDAALARCDAEAPAPIRSAPEFRRLIDGARESLGQTPDAARRRDRALLLRYLIELRSFEQLLLFRYG